MSYSLVRRPYSLSALGAAPLAPTVELPPCDISTGSAAADAAFKKCCEEAKAQGVRGVTSGQTLNKIKECSARATEDAAEEKACNAVQTGIYYVDQGFKTCCQAAWKSTGNVAERAKKLALCTADATASATLTATLAAGATGLCVAAGAVTAGITTALAATGVCGFIGGTVGVFLYNRIGGYQTQSLVLGIWAGAVCGIVSGGTLAIVCGFAVAELVEWISDKVGPVLESIFNPDAAEKRKRAEERATRAVRNAVESSLHDAEGQITDQWRASVRRIWDLYETLFPSATDRVAALSATGITNTYESIARALIAASKHFPTGAEITKYGAVPGVNAYDAALRAISRGTGIGIQYTLLDGTEVARRTANHQASCEIYGRLTKGSYGPPSQLCPPLVYRGFWDQEDSSAGKTKEFYQKLGTDYGVLVTDFFALLPMAETFVANTLTTFATVKRLDDLQKAADLAVQQNQAKFAASAWAAAKSAEVAAEEAKSWSGATRERALEKVQIKSRVATQANMLLAYAQIHGSLTSVAYRKKAAEADTMARAAVVAAQHNAHVAQFTVGSIAAAGIVGVGYLILRRT